MGLPDVESGNRLGRHLGRRDLGPFLVMGTAGIVVARDMAVVCGLARVALDGGMAREARRGADNRRVHPAGRIVFRRKPHQPRPTRTQLLLMNAASAQCWVQRSPFSAFT